MDGELLASAVSLSGRSGVQRMLAEMTPKSLFSTTLIQLISVVPESLRSLSDSHNREVFRFERRRVYDPRFGGNRCRLLTRMSMRRR